MGIGQIYPLVSEIKLISMVGKEDKLKTGPRGEIWECHLELRSI